MENTVEMTPGERSLFRSFTIREDRLEAGQLTGAERRALEQLRTMQALLGRKYPGSVLEGVSFHPGWGIKNSPELSFRAQGTDTVCTAVLTASRDGEYRLSDNYWGLLVQEQARELAQQLLPNIGVRVRIRSLMGDEVGEGLSFRDACERHLNLIPHFQFTVLPDQLPPRLSGDWREWVTQAGLYGFFQFYLSTGDSSEPSLYMGSFTVPCPPRKSKEASSSWH